MHHHEQRRLVALGQFVEGSHDVRRDLQWHSATLHLPAHRARTVQRQFDDLWNTGQRRPPELELLACRCRRIVRRTEYTALPCGEVGVLQRQCLEVRFGSRAAGCVRDDQVTGQWCHRRAVGDDVVDDHDEQVVVAGPQQPGAHRRLGGDVEAVARELGCGSEHRIGVGHVDGLEIDCCF